MHVTCFASKSPPPLQGNYLSDKEYYDITFAMLERSRGVPVDKWRSTGPPIVQDYVFENCPYWVRSLLTTLLQYDPVARKLTSQHIFDDVVGKNTPVSVGRKRTYSEATTSLAAIIVD